jgi:hypothetical protein
MTNRGLATGVFRAWGIMWAIYALIEVPHFFNLLLRYPFGSDQNMKSYAVSANAITLGCDIVIAIFLVAKSGWLAELVFPVEEQAAFSFGKDDLQAVLFSAIGLYFLIVGLQNIGAGALAILMRPRGVVVSNEYLWQKVPEQLVSGVVEAAAGAFVLFGGRRPSLAGLYQKVFGLRDPDGENRD